MVLLAMIFCCVGVAAIYLFKGIGDSESHGIFSCMYFLLGFVDYFSF